MKKGNLVQCIDDKFLEQQKQMIPYRPVKDSIYEVRQKLLTRNGPAIQLYELDNPLITDITTGLQFEPSFSVRRFVIVDPESGNHIREEIQEILETTYSGV